MGGGWLGGVSLGFEEEGGLWVDGLCWEGILSGEVVIGVVVVVMVVVTVIALEDCSGEVRVEDSGGDGDGS